MNSELLNLITARQSVRPKYLTSPAPDTLALSSAVRAACSAPSHDALLPWRFVCIEENKRSALADLFEKAARNLGGDDQKALKARSKALKGPGLVAFVLRIDRQSTVPELEQMLTAGAALENFMLALNALGYAGIILSGSVLKDKELQKAFCKNDGEELVCWITVGTPVDGAFKGRETLENIPLSAW